IVFTPIAGHTYKLVVGAENGPSAGSYVLTAGSFGPILSTSTQSSPTTLSPSEDSLSSGPLASSSTSLSVFIGSGAATAPSTLSLDRLSPAPVVLAGTTATTHTTFLSATRPAQLAQELPHPCLTASCACSGPGTSSA